MAEIVIETARLTHRYGSVTAVEDLDLQVPRGSVYGFLGANGAGKTTTIRMLLGLLRPHAGEVRLFGRPLREHRAAVLRRVGSLVDAQTGEDERDADWALVIYYYPGDGLRRR